MSELAFVLGQAGATLGISTCLGPNIDTIRLHVGIVSGRQITSHPSVKLNLPSSHQSRYNTGPKALGVAHHYGGLRPFEITRCNAFQIQLWQHGLQTCRTTRPFGRMYDGSRIFSAGTRVAIRLRTPGSTIPVPRCAFIHFLNDESATPRSSATCRRISPLTRATHAAS